MNEKFMENEDNSLKGVKFFYIIEKRFNREEIILSKIFVNDFKILFPFFQFLIFYLFYF